MNRFVFFAVMAVALLAGCSRVTVSQDYQVGLDVSRLHSYRWQQAPPASSADPRANSPLLHERFRQAIDSALQAKGFVQGPGADFLVRYDYAVERRVESEPVQPYFGLGFSRHLHYGVIGFGTDFGVRQYDVGVLVIDFSDARSGAPLWRGTASQLATMHTTPEAGSAFVQRMVDEVLAQFPPR